MRGARAFFFLAMTILSASMAANSVLAAPNQEPGVGASETAAQSPKEAKGFVAKEPSPAVSKQTNSLSFKLSESESNVAQTLRTFYPEGWSGRPLEIYPRQAAQLNVAGQAPAFQLYGLEPRIYDILAEFGMRKCYKRTYQRGQRFISCAVYFFASPEGAYGAYNFMRQGAATTVVRGAGSSEDDLSISFWKGNSFVRLTQTSEQDEESKDALRSIAKEIEADIAPTSLPPLVLNQLPVIDRVRGTEKLVMGPNSGRKFFPAPSVGQLSLERARAAVTADYRFQLPPERMKLLVIDYGNVSLAGEVYENYRSTIDAEHDTKDVTTVNTPTGIVKLDNGYMLVQLRGTRIFVITGARKKMSPLELARQIP